MHDERFDSLSERQRLYLRLVFTHHNSSEIGRQTGSSPDAVDKQLKIAMRRLGVSSRFEAARQFAAYESGVQPSDPPATGPSLPPVRSLPLPVPTKANPANTLSWRQVLIWGLVIGLLGPALITLAAAALEAADHVLGGAGHP
ncbi:helix-turn-helix domain-containing protein [Sphingomonas morindae]|uniref:Helix-turn-helix transcriptional regulator n=1 Tax=Sphingomonas morindae TaxID=1541170 RepID=A0ABY4X9Y0_9SPHN|nr:helix-turn-helix transcriptional regulator [Sphingomonas morindae]USI73768.1 helix-turn-helix transcriptional regulator [Sphingomonas morindae]